MSYCYRLPLARPFSCFNFSSLRAGCIPKTMRTDLKRTIVCRVTSQECVAKGALSWSSWSNQDKCWVGIIWIYCMIFGCPKNQIKADHIPQHGEGIFNTACILLAVLPDKKSATSALVIDIYVYSRQTSYIEYSELKLWAEHLHLSTIIFHHGFLIT